MKLYKILFLFFITWPLIGGIYALRHFNTRAGRLFYVLFFGICGYSYFIADSASDTYAYLEWFLSSQDLTFSDYFQELNVRLFTLKSLKPEIFQYSIEFWLSRITSNSSVYFSCLFAILGIGIVSNVKILAQLYNEKKTQYGLFFIIFFLIIMSPVKVASFRHYLSCMVFLYSFYKYVETKEIKYLVGIFSTVFIHIGFSIAIICFLIYFFFGSSLIFYLILLSIAFALKDEFPSLIANNVDLFSGDFKAKAYGYSYERIVEERLLSKQSAIFILKVYLDWTKWFFIFSTFYWYFTLKKLDNISKAFFLLSVIFMSLVFLTSKITAISERFTVMYFLICIMFMVRIFCVQQFKNNVLFTISTVFILALNFTVAFRHNLEFLSSTSLLPFLPLHLFVDSDINALDILDFFRR